MLENQSRDPEVNLKSILGRDDLVMNLRPLDKTKHVGEKSHFIYGPHTAAQRMQDEALLYRKIHLDHDALGLPPVNERVGKMIKKYNRMNNDSKKFNTDNSEDDEDYERDTKTDNFKSKKSRNIALSKVSSK